MKLIILTLVVCIMLLSVSHLIYKSKARVVEAKKKYELKQQEIKREQILKEVLGLKP
jgi:hypothetical protein